MAGFVRGSCIAIQDSGTDERFTDTTLVINLVDVLDPPPAFSLREYNIEVAEGMYTDVSENDITHFIVTAGRLCNMK